MTRISISAAHGRGRAPLEVLSIFVLALCATTSIFARGAFARSERSETAKSAQNETKPVPEAPTVVAITVEGVQRYTEQQILDAIGQKIGAKLERDVVARGVETLWKVFHVKADVQYRDVEGGLELHLRVSEQPVDLEPRFIGNAEIKTETLRKWALLEEKGELYLYQSARVRQRLLEGYHREGYSFADVKAVTRGGADKPEGQGLAPDVIFEIREGPQVHVKDVVIEGDRSMPDTGMLFWKGGLRKLARLELSGPWIFSWKGSKFVEDVLEADLIAMRNVYRDRGWLDAVVELERLEFSPDRSRVTIHVIIDEGVPYRVSKLELQAVDRKYDAKHEAVDTPVELIFPAEDLLRLCKMKAGKRFERTQQQADSIALRDFYGERGYISHPSLRAAGADSWEFLDPDLRFDPDKHEVEVTYRLTQGRKRFIRGVLFQGAERTRDRVLRREVSVLPGQRADTKEISRSLQRLYSTGYFTDESAPLDHKDPTYRFIPTDDPDWVDLEYIVEEGRVVNFQVQAGVDSNNGLFGRISLSMKNFDIADPPHRPWTLFEDVYDKEAFHGAGQRFDIDLSPGTIVNYYRIHFLEPDLFRTQFDRYSLDLELSDRTRQYRFYDEDRFDRRIRIGREFGRDLALYVGYTNQNLDISNIRAPLTGINPPTGFPIPEGIFEQEGKSRLVGGLFDVRYRDVDNTNSPRAGFTASWRNGVYGSVFGGDYEFARSEVDLDWYRLVGSPEQDVRPGFHLGLALGGAQSFGASRDVPYTERFFFGGSQFLRGFAYRGVGPNIGGEPIGGSTALSGTIEYRLPIYSVVQPGTYKNIEMFRMLFFADAGVLDPDPFQLDLGELRASVGFGFGMASPLPLSFNFGFPIRSGEGDRKQTFSFTILSFGF